MVRSLEGAPSIGTRALRLARSSDTPGLLALINEAYLVEAHFVSGPRTTAAAVSALVARGEFIVLDRAGGDLLASAHVRTSGPVGHLGLLSVSPDLQGQGLGRRMVTVAELLVAARGGHRMELQVVNIREELLHFYSGLGYQIVGSSPFDESKSTLKPVHFVDMRKELEPGGPEH